MKTTIQRTLFWFQDGEEELTFLNDRFFPLGNLMNRLLSEVYNGKKIKFINLNFRTEKTYKLFPEVSKHWSHFYGGLLRRNDVFDIDSFYRKGEGEQNIFIWECAYKALCKASEETKNMELLKASNYAYRKGLVINLNADYKMIEAEAVLHGEQLQAAVWVHFYPGKDRMYSKFTLEKEGAVILEKDLDEARLGIEFFLEMYKKIEVKGNSIIIKGHYEVDYLPLKIPIDISIIKSKF